MRAYSCKNKRGSKIQAWTLLRPCKVRTSKARFSCFSNLYVIDRDEVSLELQADTYVHICVVLIC